MSERKNEAAWIEKSQRWQIKVQKDGERKAFYSTKPGKKGKIEAEKKADAWLSSGRRETGTRFGKVWDAYVMREKEIRGENSTVYLQAEYFGRLYLKPRLEHKKLSSITAQDWQDCIDYAYRDKDLSQKTLKNMRGAITAFWKYLRRAQVLFAQPDDALTIPSKAKVLERTIVQPGALQKVFEVDGHEVRGRWYQPHYLYAWRFALTTGLRPGELIGLRHEDISGSVITLSRAINVYGEETAGKNRRARRSFHLPAEALNILDDQRLYLLKLGILSPWVFPATDGGPASEKTLYKTWRNYCEILGIPKTSLYEQRHTFVSLNYAVPDTLLKTMVGHGHSMDTRGQYGHELEGQSEKTADLVNKSISLVLQKQ